MNSNPFQMLQALTNPQQFVQNLMNNNKVMQNPMMKNGVDMFNKGDVKGLQSLVNNIATQKGTTVDEVRKRLGI